MNTRTVLIINLLAAVLFFSEYTPAVGIVKAATFESICGAVQEDLRDKISNKIHKKWFTCRGEIICGISSIPRFYKNRDYRPAWMGDDASFTLADDLLIMIRESDRHGLIPDNYHIQKISELLHIVQSGNPTTQMDPMVGGDLDILLTDAFLLYTSHLVSGRVNPETIHSEWEAFSPKTNLTQYLTDALDANAIKETLQYLAPQHPGYLRLQEALALYRDRAKKGGWPKLSPGTTLRLWDLGPRVILLKKRLSFWENDHHPPSETSYEFDEALEDKVKRFQRRHGLKTDGIVGTKTLAALNVPISRRVRQIEINLERWRWFPRDMEEKHIIVNIADFKLAVMEGLTPVMDMRVVVGKSYRKTPVFSETMKFLVLNPYWNIPTKIAVEDLVPDICEDLNTIYKKDILVFENWGENAALVDPETISWCQLDQTNFRYKLRQNPGPKNSLGRIKFIFPNKYAVYLHDTPQKSLFKKASRVFSSGCIRIENPIGLATYLLQEDPDWTKEALISQIETRERKVVALKHRMPVHLVYLTAWVKDTGEVQFRKDVYERDAALDLALKERFNRDYADSGPESSFK